MKRLSQILISMSVCVGVFAQQATSPNGKISVVSKGDGYVVAY